MKTPKKLEIIKIIILTKRGRLAAVLRDRKETVKRGNNEMQSKTDSKNRVFYVLYGILLRNLSGGPVLL